MSPSRIFTQTEIEAEYFPDSKVWTSVLTTGEHMQLIWAEFEPDGEYRLHSHPPRADQCDDQRQNEADGW